MSNALVQVGPAEKLDSGKQLLRGTLGGTLGVEEYGVIQAWAEGIHESIRDLAGTAEKSVCVLLDIRSMKTYTEPRIITILTDLMKEDNPFIYKTATFGGTPLHVMIENVIGSMANRQNLRNFDTEDQALAWLKA